MTDIQVGDLVRLPSNGLAVARAVSDEEVLVEFLSSGLNMRWRLSDLMSPPPLSLVTEQEKKRAEEIRDELGLEEQMTDVKVGDLVRLPSGGLAMVRAVSGGEALLDPFPSGNKFRLAVDSLQVPPPVSITTDREKAWLEEIRDELGLGAQPEATIRCQVDLEPGQFWEQGPVRITATESVSLKVETFDEPTEEPPEEESSAEPQPGTHASLVYFLNKNPGRRGSLYVAIDPDRNSLIKVSQDGRVLRLYEDGGFGNGDLVSLYSGSAYGASAFKRVRTSKIVRLVEEHFGSKDGVYFVDSAASAMVRYSSGETMASTRCFGSLDESSPAAGASDSLLGLMHSPHWRTVDAGEAAGVLSRIGEPGRIFYRTLSDSVSPGRLYCYIDEGRDCGYAVVDTDGWIHGGVNGHGPRSWFERQCASGDWEKLSSDEALALELQAHFGAPE